MKKWVTIMMVVVLILVCSSVAFARTYDHDDDHLFLEVDYSLPYNNIYTVDSFSYGAGFRFWGIFFFSTMYTENLDFLTCGTGMKIPLGGFGLVWEWSNGYGISGGGGIFDFCESYKVGLELDLSDSLGLQVYKKYLSGFSVESGMSGRNIDFIGAGVVINF